MIPRVLPGNRGVSQRYYEMGTPKFNQYIFGAFLLIALEIGMGRAIFFSWVSDDAFISFRYARNLVHGAGLVYNPGERVEGYTNFLWTMLLAAGMKLGLDPLVIAKGLGISSYAGILALAGIISWRLGGGAGGRRSSGKMIAVPLAALALAIHRDMAVYATGGLETALFTGLILVIFALLTLRQSGSRASLLTAGTLFAMLLMTRPDGIVILGVSILFILLTERAPVRALSFVLLPVIVVYVPYWVWRYHYYGFAFPNTFYAKSVSLSYYSQGAFYLWLYFKTYYVFTLLPLVFLAACYSKWDRIRESWRSPLNAYDHFRDIMRASSRARVFLLGSLCTSAWLAFVLRIGGDFMFARFIIPVTPLLFILIEELVREAFDGWARYALVLIVLAGTFVRWDQFRTGMMRGYVVDECQWYDSGTVDKARRDGLFLNQAFHDLPVRIAFGGSLAMVVYYADPALAIESANGLTDSTIAHQNIGERGRPGHEKAPPPEYLERRGVHFIFGPPRNVPCNTAINDLIEFGSLSAHILTYDNAVMIPLRSNPQVVFTSFPEYLDRYLDQIQALPPGKIQEDYLQFKRYYFDHNVDSVRENRMLRLLQRRFR